MVPGWHIRRNMVPLVSIAAYGSQIHLRECRDRKRHAAIWARVTRARVVFGLEKL